MLLLVNLLTHSIRLIEKTKRYATCYSVPSSTSKGRKEGREETSDAAPSRLRSDEIAARQNDRFRAVCQPEGTEDDEKERNGEKLQRR